MSRAISTASGLPEAEHDRHLRRALIASTVGTTVEWYDFLFYGTVTGLVFGKLFFPGVGAVDRRAAGLRGVLHRVRWPADRRCDFRPFW